MNKNFDKKTTRYNLFLVSIVVISLIILVVFSFFALTFLIKNINLLVKPITPEKETNYLKIDKAKEIFKDVSQ
ncbi:MAG: hypothetical protein ACPLW7_02280 [Minisyncoccia bacterium]